MNQWKKEKKSLHAAPQLSEPKGSVTDDNEQGLNYSHELRLCPAARPQFFMDTNATLLQYVRGILRITRKGFLVSIINDNKPGKFVREPNGANMVFNNYLQQLKSKIDAEKSLEFIIFFSSGSGSPIERNKEYFK